MRSFSLKRLQSDAAATHSRIGEGDNAICEALELAYHVPKIAGKTRIPSGIYLLGFRAASHFDVVYRERVERAGQVYRGMIEILGVPDFSAVLFHCGNTPSDSKACVLCGERVAQIASGYVIPAGESEPAFLRLYREMSVAIAVGSAQLIVADEDR